MTPAVIPTRFDIDLRGKILLAFLILGLLLLLAGFFTDYGRAQKGSDPTNKKKASTWSTWLQSAAILKITGSFCLIGSVTIASFKFDSLVRITAADAPAEIQITLQHFVDELTTRQQIIQIADQPKPKVTPKPGDAPKGEDTPKTEDAQPKATSVETSRSIKTTEVDCHEQDPERFIIKTFKLGKNDELEDQKPPTEKLDAILDTIESSAKTKELQGFVFIGSADRVGLGKTLREQHGSNSILARKRAEFIREKFQERLKSRRDIPPPRWILLLNPDVPMVRLTIDDGKQFNGLRAVQICVAWTKPEREASRL
jgi:hypothetical protein